MASKTESSLSNAIVTRIQEYFTLEEGEITNEQKAAYSQLAQEIVLVDEHRKVAVPAVPVAAPVAAPVADKKFIYKAKAVAPVANYQQFVRVVSAAWKYGECELGTRAVTPIKGRASKSAVLLATLVGESEITWGISMTFKDLLTQVRQHTNERLSAVGVCWLMLDDTSRAVICE